MAEQIAREFINRPEWRGAKGPFAILPELTEMTASGWLFFYDVETYLQTREESDDCLISNVPILVEISDGWVHPLHPSGIPIDVLLAEYEEGRTRQVRCPTARWVYGLETRRDQDMHITLDHQQTLCGQSVPAVPPGITLRAEYFAQRLVGTEGRPAIEVKPGGLWTLRGTVAQRAANTRRDDWESGGARRRSSMR